MLIGRAAVRCAGGVRQGPGGAGCWPDAEFAASSTRPSAISPSGAPLTGQQGQIYLNTIAKDPADRDLARCEAMFQTCYARPTIRRAIRAFAEKRKPVFTGQISQNRFPPDGFFAFNGTR